MHIPDYTRASQTNQDNQPKINSSPQKKAAVDTRVTEIRTRNQNRQITSE